VKLLALDAATEQCSVALRIDAHCISRSVVTPRGHAELILPMIDEVLDEAGLKLNQLDAIAFGRGPGAFTGVRIAIGVVQGLAFACDLPVIGISNLAAVAQRCPVITGEILVCMDARMNEVYWGRFKFADDGLVTSTSDEQVSSPETVIALTASVTPAFAMTIGTGLSAYPALREHFRKISSDATALPHAVEIAKLGERDFERGLAVDAAHAQPVYLRDQVTHVKPASTVS